MRENDDRTLDSQRSGHATKVVNALREPTLSCQAFTETHPQVVHRDDPHVWSSGRKHPTPQIRPGGVAVNSQHGESRLLHTIVEYMPRPRDAVGIVTGDQTGPGGIEPG